MVTIYLLPSIMPKVEAKLRAELKPGTRVVVHDYPFPNWKPVKVIERESLGQDRHHRLRLHAALRLHGPGQALVRPRSTPCSVRNSRRVFGP